MSSATTSELPSPVEVEQPEDPELFHYFCEDGPRNNPVPTVMCCGLAAEKAGETKPRTTEPECALCILAFESGVCACFYYS